MALLRAGRAAEPPRGIRSRGGAGACEALAEWPCAACSPEERTHSLEKVPRRAATRAPARERKPREKSRALERYERGSLLNLTLNKNSV